ncbi:hypothetical protein O6H91_Y195200 [Diphasiastrum complanatum]|nr:hypothetical protein O6H91_Y195200 [Diphasiastrum complanatum]
MREPSRTSVMKSAISGIADLGNKKNFLQEFFNRQSHLGQFSAVYNTLEDLKSLSSDPKADLQFNSDLIQSSLKTYRHLYKSEEENAGVCCKSIDNEAKDSNLESTTNQIPSDDHNPGYRCKRMDGKGWQCLRQAEAGFSLCEYHLSRFRANHIRRKATKVVKVVMPSKPELSGRKRSKKKSAGTILAEQVVADRFPQPFQRKRKPMKARSIMSIH